MYLASYNASHWRKLGCRRLGCWMRVFVTCSDLGAWGWGMEALNGVW